MLTKFFHQKIYRTDLLDKIWLLNLSSELLRKKYWALDSGRRGGNTLRDISASFATVLCAVWPGRSWRRMIRSDWRWAFLDLIIDIFIFPRSGNYLSSWRLDGQITWRRVWGLWMWYWSVLTAGPTPPPLPGPTICPRPASPGSSASSSRPRRGWSGPRESSSRPGTSSIGTTSRYSVWEIKSPPLNKYLWRINKNKTEHCRMQI